MRLLTVFLLMAALVAGPRAGVADVCEVSGAAVTHFGDRYLGTAAQVSAESPRATLRHVDPGHPVRYLRLRITLQEASGGQWQLVLRDNDYRPLQVLGPKEIAVGSSRWSERLDTPTVKLDLRILDATSSAKIAVVEYIAMPEGVEHAFYSIQGAQPAWKDLFEESNQAWKRVGDAVGMLVAGWQQHTWCCSGVVVQRTPALLFLTNFHCGAPDPTLADSAYWSDAVCASTVVDFSWDGDGSGREFACAKVAAVDPDRDLAVIELAQLGPDPGPPPPPLYMGAPADVSDLVILHHPECRQKQISSSCQVASHSVAGWRSGSGPSDFTHRCDTEAGSSGAPVFDPNGRLVGVHHLGFEKQAGVCDRLNKGVWLSAGTEVLESAGVVGLSP